MGNRRQWILIMKPVFIVVWSFALASLFVSADRGLMVNDHSNKIDDASDEPKILLQVKNFLWQSDQSGYHHVWPKMTFDWKIVVGSIIGFCGAAFGSVGGVGGGGIFVPMLDLIVGFDPKSAAAISKCMIMGSSVSTVYCNIKRRHPTIDMPLIDYDLAVLIQPMLMLGISTGVAFNVLFADWMVTVLLIFIFVGTSTKAFLKGIETWKKETILKQEAEKCHVGNGNEEAEYKLLPDGPSGETNKEVKDLSKEEVTVLENVCWKEFGLLVYVWVSFLALQIAKNYTANCSIEYWLLNLLQIPIAVGVSLYEAISLYSGRRAIASKGDSGSRPGVKQLIIYCLCSVSAGVVGGLLGLGGGFILGPLFLELGVPPQVSSATAIFAIMFSSSMSVIEFYLLKRFPVPYAIYFICVATIAAFVGQHVVRRIINILGRASLIIFILASTIFISAISLGGVGISNMIGKIQNHDGKRYYLSVPSSAMCQG